MVSMKILLFFMLTGLVLLSTGCVSQSDQPLSENNQVPVLENNNLKNTPPAPQMDVLQTTPRVVPAGFLF